MTMLASAAGAATKLPALDNTKSTAITLMLRLMFGSFGVGFGQ
jgi:hypothetical protein